MNYCGASRYPPLEMLILCSGHFGIFKCGLDMQLQGDMVDRLTENLTNNLCLLERICYSDTTPRRVPESTAIHVPLYNALLSNIQNIFRRISMKMDDMVHFLKRTILSLVLTSLICAVIVNGFAGGDEGYYVEIGKECPSTEKICIYSLDIEERLVLRHDDTQTVAPPSKYKKKTDCILRGGTYVPESDTCLEVKDAI